MKTLFISVLAFLVHHANRLGRDTAFYRIKDVLLRKYGTSDGFDLQVIPGKPCFSCGGDGSHEDYFSDDDYVSDECHRCEGTGWYKHPFYVQLYRYTLGKYRFHLPGNKVYAENPPAELVQISAHKIETYIQHATPARYARICKMILFLVYNFNEFAYRLTPYSWRNPGHYSWHLWKPAHIWQNLKHIISWAIRTRGKHIPLFKDLREKRIAERNHRQAMAEYRVEQSQLSLSDEDLPF